MKEKEEEEETEQQQLSVIERALYVSNTFLIVFLGSSKAVRACVVFVRVRT